MSRRPAVPSGSWRRDRHTAADYCMRCGDKRIVRFIPHVTVMWYNLSD